MGKCISCFIAPSDDIVEYYAKKLRTPERMYLFVRDRLVYTPEEQIDYWATPRSVLLNMDKNGNAYGDCDDASILLSSLLWNRGYKNKIVLAELPNKGGFFKSVGHMYVILSKKNGQEVKLDPTCKKCKFGQFPVVDETIIGYIEPNRTTVINPQLYKRYVTDRFGYGLDCEHIASPCKDKCSLFGSCSHEEEEEDEEPKDRNAIESETSKVIEPETKREEEYDDIVEVIS